MQAAAVSAPEISGETETPCSQESQPFISVEALAEGYEEVLDVLRLNYKEKRECGAQVCAIVNGKVVVDINAGQSESDPSRLKSDSLAMVFSCSKVIESLVIAMCVDRGLLKYDEPVATYWPEFAAVSPTATVAHLMRHQAGVCHLDPPMKKADLLPILHDPVKLGELLNKNVAAWTPEDPPKIQKYHAITRGLYSAELVRRVDGRTMDQFVQDEIVAKCGDNLDFHFGCQPEDQDRVATHRSTQSKAYVAGRLAMQLSLPKWAVEKILDKDMDMLHDFDIEVMKGLTSYSTRRAMSLFHDSFEMPVSLANDPELRAMPLASACGITNASTLATIGNALIAEPGKLLSQSGLEQALNGDGPLLRDELLCRKITMSNCGWGLDRFEAFGCPGWVGWAGMGGSMFVFDPARKAVFSYVVTGLTTQQYKARGVRLLRAFQTCIHSSQS